MFRLAKGAANGGLFVYAFVVAMKTGEHSHGCIKAHVYCLIAAFVFIHFMPED